MAKCNHAHTRCVDIDSDAHSSESETDDESSDSSISGESDSSDDENRFENAVIRVGKEYQCSDIQSVSAVTVPSNSDCVTDSRAGTVVWSPTRISASELERYLTMLRDLETRSAADEYMIDPWPREAFGKKPWVQERDRDPCASLKRGEIPSDHPSVKPESGYPLRMDTGLHHLAECNYDIEQAGLGLQDVFQKDHAEVDYAMLMIEAIKTHGKDFAKVCSAVNEVVATDAVRLGKRPDPVTVAHVTEFYYSKWRHTNACEEWRRSAQYRQSKQEVHGQQNSRQDNHAATSRLLSSKRRKSDNAVHASSNGESDGESDGESASEREREQERRRSRASVAAARKLELEAQQALRQSLRQPPDICTTGTVDPRVNGELPAAWTCNRAEISRRPSAQELGTWVPEALEAYWAARWRAWDREKLRVLQRACGRLSLAATGDKFDLVLRLTRFDMGGGGPALLLLDDLTGPLHQTVADELWARGQMPSITAGDVNMIGDAGGLLVAAKQLPLPTAAVLRSWTLESQREFWLWRWREWVKRSMAECQAACAACTPALWAVAKPARRSIRARLCLHEFAPEFLGARDLAGFYELESQYLEVQFDDDSCESYSLSPASHRHFHHCLLVSQGGLGKWLSSKALDYSCSGSMANQNGWMTFNVKMNIAW